ncbi:hypothetical protein Taro_046782 [Colocasia esculenta]|uniref:Uncharacterized protein n=1 Tax=Colocasia esculenta TaxID=4460 RepID=A0A843X5Z4_COLES|nr:hypothetical protein [Colocasia esculenta]
MDPCRRGGGGSSARKLRLVGDSTTLIIKLKKSSTMAVRVRRRREEPHRLNLPAKGEVQVSKGGWTIVERVALLNCARKRRGVVQFPWELAEGSM